MAGRRDPWVRWFDVTSPQKHAGGYTIYKVTSKVFPVLSPEATTETVVWKRYNDFLKLHKTLFLLHRNLHRQGTFPDFPKPRVFGRFDEAVIEERRQASLQLLNFVASQPHLFNSLPVQQFFEVSEKKEVPKPDQNILQPVSVSSPPSATDEELNNSNLAEDSQQEQSGAPSTSPSVTESEQGVTVLPEGDNLGERPDIDVLVEGGVASAPELTITSLADNESPIASSERSGLIESLSGVWAHRHPDNSDSETSDLEPSRPQSVSSIDQRVLFDVGEDQQEVLAEIMNEFDPCRQSSSPREASAVSNSRLLSECVNASGEHSTDSLAAMDQSKAELEPPADTLGEYVQSKDDYLYKAVKQIRRALQEEQQEHYQLAFDYYKRAVALLLTGVQSDGDAARRSVVKRKTAQYLVYAEQLHSQYLDSSGADTDRWKQLQVPRHVARLRVGLSGLSNYKVLGLIGGNMLVLDKLSGDTRVIKVLKKNAEVTERSWGKQVIPTKCSRMIKLIKYFESECTIYLLLEYAQGGTLWEYAHNYLQTSDSSPGLPQADGANNIYSGRKYPTTSDVSQSQDDGQKTSAGGEDNSSDNYLNMLLGIDSPPSGQPSAESSSHASVESTHSSAKEAALQGKTTPPLSPGDEVFSDKETSPRGSDTPPSLTRRMSLQRSNSSKSRSVSVERASDSINSARHRNWSSVFDELGGSGNRKQLRAHLPESCVQRWAAELLMAINELHRVGLILGDLRPDNLLLDSRGHIILTYFCRWPGVRQELNRKSQQQFYVSPESTLPGATGVASDYWSFGIILYELLAGVSLASVHPEGITSHTLLKTPEHLSTEASHLLKHLLRHNWRERLGGGAAGVEEIKAHPFFQGIDWSTV